MKITIDRKHIYSLRKGCIERAYQLQIHETVEPEIVHAYVMDRGRDLTENQAFWLGVWFQAELSRVLLAE